MKNYKPGDRVRVTQQTCGHNIPIGTIIILGMALGNGFFQVPDRGTNINPSDIEPALKTKEDFEKELASLEAKTEAARQRVAFMKKTKSDTFDETEFKVYQALQEIKGKGSDLAKAKAIAKLINPE